MSRTPAAGTAAGLAAEDGGRTEVEFEVDQDRVGVVWNVVIRRGSAVVVRRTAVTRAPGGSFEVNRRVAGRGAYRARAVNPRTGEVCTASARI